MIRRPPRLIVCGACIAGLSLVLAGCRPGASSESESPFDAAALARRLEVGSKDSVQAHKELEGNELAADALLDRLAIEEPLRAAAVGMALLQTHPEKTRRRLEQMLASADPLERSAAATVLGADYNAKPRILDKLIKVAKTDPEIGVRRAAIFAIAHKKSPRVESVLTLSLSDKDLKVRRLAALELFERGKLSATSEPIHDLLSDPQEGMKLLFIEALGKSTDKDAGKVLQRLTSDPSPRVRDWAEQVLRERENPK